MTENIYIIASKSDDWAYYWYRDLKSVFHDVEELEIIENLEIGQIYHVDDGRAVIRVIG